MHNLSITKYLTVIRKSVEFTSVHLHPLILVKEKTLNVSCIIVNIVLGDL